MTAFAEEESAEARQEFVVQLRETGAAHSPRILDTCAEIPRERFVSIFYHHDEATLLHHTLLTLIFSSAYLRQGELSRAKKSWL